MMGWYVGDHMTGWGWVGMTLSSILFIALLVLGGMLLIRVARQADRPAAPRSPEQVLAERYARGELSDEEYRQRLDTLRDTGALTGSGGGAGRRRQRLDAVPGAEGVVDSSASRARLVAAR